MGYTHYWTQKRSFTKDEWAEILTGMHFLYEHAHENGIKLTGHWDKIIPPLATAEIVDFNGVGEHQHETMQITRKRQKDNWNFCKTARKPYDIIATALLAYLDSIHPEKFVVTSDGDTADWTIGTERGMKGVELARLAWPNKANQIQVPRDVRDQGRYAQYLDHSKTYQVAVGHDGKVWIERHKDRHRIHIEAFEGPNRWDSRDVYNGWIKALPHSHRKYGSFHGNESTLCETRRLKAVWDWARLNSPIEEPDLFMPLAA